MISWKHSFKRLNEEFEMAKKKRQALENLLNSGRISQSTYEVFNSEIASAISEIERQQRDLLEKMNSKMRELEEQIKTLEMLFANFEIQHVAGEVEEEVYQHEISLLSTGLEAARRELETVKEAVNQLSSSMQIQTAEVVVEQKIESQPTENVKVEEKPAPAMEEKMPEPPVEHVESSEACPASEQTQDSLQATEENQPVPIEPVVEEKKEA
ncbi:MAG: CdvA-like protein [Candidatus Bathyarchaeia archaeon]